MSEPTLLREHSPLLASLYRAVHMAPRDTYVVHFHHAVHFISDTFCGYETCALVSGRSLLSLPLFSGWTSQKSYGESEKATNRQRN